LVDTGENENLGKASRNLEGVKLVQTIALEPYDLLRHDRLMISRPAAEKLSRSLAVTKTKRADAPVQIAGAAPKPAAGETKSAAKPKAEKAARPAKAAAKPKAKAKAPAKPKGKKE
ncbi:MAG TPA: 50S ribosomal protein L4, partial [Candidatus Acidoferrales bacterium]|nr:50S ribosomal protein L4 [Candidatus Acidoferrales bacterium]